MIVRALGCGGMYAKAGQWQTNYAVTHERADECEPVLLIDCGTDIRHTIERDRIRIDDVDAIYITHEHADHCGGLPFFAYMSITRSGPHARKIKLFLERELVQPVWQMLEPQCRVFGGKLRGLNDYFDLVVMDDDTPMGWNKFTLTSTFYPHVMGPAGECAMPSHGVTVYEASTGTWAHFTGDLAPHACKAVEWRVRKLSGKGLAFVDCGWHHGGDKEPPVHPDLEDWVNTIREKPDLASILVMGHYPAFIFDPDTCKPSGPWHEKALEHNLRFAEPGEMFDTTRLATTELEDERRHEPGQPGSGRRADRGPGPDAEDAESAEAPHGEGQE